MSAAPRFLYLRIHPGQPSVLERLSRFDAGVRLLGGDLVVPLGDRRAEEVLAECRRVGVRVLGSVVHAADSAG